jgi:hypothetical protein
VEVRVTVGVAVKVAVNCGVTVLVDVKVKVAVNCGVTVLVAVAVEVRVTVGVAVRLIVVEVVGVAVSAGEPGFVGLLLLPQALMRNNTGKRRIADNK